MIRARGPAAPASASPSSSAPRSPTAVVSSSCRARRAASSPDWGLPLIKTTYAIEPPVEPMLAKLADQLAPEGEDLYEPKWDGFRALVFRGLDGVIAKPAELTYQPGKRAMIKVKHARTADCVVAGFRWYKSGNDAVGSLLLGLYDDEGVLQHVGVTSSFTLAMRKALVKELAPLRKDAIKDHPWRDWAGAEAH